ncbi:hypothetical protein Tco_1558810 [Tanacetum coccineum]
MFIEQSRDEVYGCLKGGSRNSRGKRLAISMVEETWLSEERGMIERQIVFSWKRKNVLSKRKNVFVEEKECFHRRERMFSSKRKNVFVEEKECFRRRERMFLSKRKNVFIEEKWRAF